MTSGLTIAMLAFGEEGADGRALCESGPSTDGGDEDGADANLAKLHRHMSTKKTKGRGGIVLGNSVDATATTRARRIRRRG